MSKIIEDMKNGETSNSVSLKTVGDLKRVLKYFTDDTRIEHFVGWDEGWTEDKYSITLETNMYEDYEGDINDNPLYLGVGVGGLPILDYINKESEDE